MRDSSNLNSLSNHEMFHIPMNRSLNDLEEDRKGAAMDVLLPRRGDIGKS